MRQIFLRFYDIKEFKNITVGEIFYVEKQGN